MEVNKIPISIGIFIFYSKPTNEYVSTLRTFIDLSLGINKIFIYSLSDYPKCGLYDVLEDIIHSLRKLEQNKFHYIMIYLENTLISDTDVYKDILWFKSFDIYICDHVVIIYKDVIDFELPMFQYEIVPVENEINIYHHSIDIGLANKYILIDNYNIEELCNDILKIDNEMDMYQFLIGRRYEDNRSTIYCNFTPSNLVNLFYNYRYRTLFKISGNDIIPVFVSTIGIRVLNILYKQLKVCQKNRLLSLI